MRNPNLWNALFSLIGQLKWSNILLNRYVAITMFQTKSKILLRIFLNLKLQECYIGVGHVRAITFLSLIEIIKENMRQKEHRFR